MTTRPRRIPSMHPVNQQMIDEAPLGVRVADDVTGFMGSWRFIVIQTIIVVILIVWNIILLFHFDPYPFHPPEPRLQYPGRVRRAAHPSRGQPQRGARSVDA